MVGRLMQILAEFDFIPSRLLRVTAFYLLSCMLKGGKRGYSEMSKLFGLFASNFMRFIARGDGSDLAFGMLNRSSRRLIEKLRRKGKLKREDIFIIIDATYIGRSSKNVENSQFFSCGNSKVFGHKITNFLLVIGDHTIPLGVSAHYTEEYCLNYEKTYKTESERVVKWIDKFPYSGFLTRDEIKNTTFLLDSGYDAKKIQKAIRRIGSHFLVSLHRDRCISGKQVQTYFKQNRRISWQPIRIMVGNGSRQKRNEYKIRVATEVRLKGVGNVTVVFSKNKKGKSKYIATSNLELSGREIVLKYRKRWKKESWHRKMKQDYGYGDCRSSSFESCLTHILWTIVAFIMRSLFPDKLPKEGTTNHEYQAATRIIEISEQVTQFGFKNNTKKLAFEASQGLVGRKCA